MTPLDDLISGQPETHITKATMRTRKAKFKKLGLRYVAIPAAAGQQQGPESSGGLLTLSKADLDMDLSLTKKIDDFSQASCIRLKGLSLCLIS